jgi:hypothetical protein
MCVWYSPRRHAIEQRRKPCGATTKTTSLVASGEERCTAFDCPTPLALSNGTSVIVKKFLGKILALPIDGGLALTDGRPLFGSSKALRGRMHGMRETRTDAALDLKT